MEKGKDNAQDAGKDEPYRVRLPGFISDEQVGLGDVVKRITYAAGIKPCGGCECRRPESLDDLYTLTRHGQT